MYKSLESRDCALALLGALFSVFATTGCSGDSSATPCKKDTECKGDRICVDGTCMDTPTSTTGTGGASSSGGGGDPCSRGAEASCYDGPPSTENVGSCQSGTQSCSTDGSGYGPCTGQTLPTSETCTSPALDENCDGIKGCNGEHLWSRGFGGGFTRAVAISAKGDLFATGTFSGSADFGNGVVSSAAQSDLFLVRLDTNAKYVWGRQFQLPGFAYVEGLVRDDADNVAITGWIGGNANFGGATFTPVNSDAIFVAVYNQSGDHIWSRSFEGTSSPTDSYAISFDKSGDVLVGGRFSGSINFGGIDLVGSGSAFLTKLSSSGEHIWSKTFPGEVRSIAVDSKNNIYIAGPFLAKLDPAGNQLWSKSFGGTIAVDRSDNVILGGGFTGTVDFGGGLLASSGSVDIFLAKFDANGAHVWSHRYGDADLQFITDVSADESDNISFIGNIRGSIDFGAGVLSGDGIDDVTVGKLTSTGDLIWARRFGDALHQHSGDAIAADAFGNVFFGGYFDKVIDLGGDLLSGSNSYNAYVAKFAP